MDLKMNLNWSLIGRFVPIRLRLGKESPQFPLTSVLKLSLSLQDNILVSFSSQSVAPLLLPSPRIPPPSPASFNEPIQDPQSPQGDGKIYQVPAIPN